MRFKHFNNGNGFSTRPCRNDPCYIAHHQADPLTALGELVPCEH